MNSIHLILESLVATQSNLQKIKILEQHVDNELLKKIFVYAYDPFRNFYVIKLPKVGKIDVLELKDQWERFFLVADRCCSRKLAGNAARNEMTKVFSAVSAENEAWMRKILKKHLNIGLSATTLNKVWSNLIPTFTVSLATVFDDKERSSLLSKGIKFVGIEPKLDGIRCITIIKDGVCTMLSREGKPIENFKSTIGSDMGSLPEGVYDGEIMSTKFSAMMKQYRRKENIDNSDIVLHVFDMLPYDEWISKKSLLSCQARREHLEDLNINNTCKYVRLIKRDVADIAKIDEYHTKNVKDGFEGTMIKLLDSPYVFGRSKSVYKFKNFLDIDLPIAGFYNGKEGSDLEHTLGGIYVEYKGKLIGVGSGFSDEQRNVIWANRRLYLGKIAEIRYQEETDDGSFRFPTFVCVRNDKSNNE